MSLDGLRRWIRQSGAKTEAETARDGFLSWKAETHAVGSGLGFGFAIGASGDLSIVGAFVSLVVYGNRHHGQDGKARKMLDPALVEDILAERHYFMASFATGLALGVITRLLTGAASLTAFTGLL